MLWKPGAKHTTLFESVHYSDDELKTDSAYIVNNVFIIVKMLFYSQSLH